MDFASPKDLAKDSVGWWILEVCNVGDWFCIFIFFFKDFFLDVFSLGLLGFLEFVLVFQVEVLLFAWFLLGNWAIVWPF